MPLKLSLSATGHFRTHFNQENNWLTGSFTLEEIERIAMKDFVSDEILKTFLNAERFVGVGDSIFYWHAGKIQIAIHKDYSRGILTLSNLPRIMILTELVHLL
ncbi:MAG: hypothetical protein IPH24_12245 [Crocinitomicaceae bacterium]|nr:hypothetical protein [Crocinitomicaceae bacterium]